MPELSRFAARQRAKALIGQHLHDTAVSAQKLARLLVLSRSVLYRLFEPDEGVADFIRARRLQRLCAALADPTEHRRITEKSCAIGFAQVSLSRYLMSCAVAKGAAEVRSF